MGGGKLLIEATSGNNTFCDQVFLVLVKSITQRKERAKRGGGDLKKAREEKKDVLLL
jgi:hypothetical protein